MIGANLHVIPREREWRTQLALSLLSPITQGKTKQNKTVRYVGPRGPAQLKLMVFGVREACADGYSHAED